MPCTAKMDLLSQRGQKKWEESVRAIHVFITEGGGHEGVARLLLGWQEHAPRADCQRGVALLEAVRGGHEGVVRLLLGWPVHAPRADCQGGIALLEAARGGYEGVVRLLIEWPLHDMRADCQEGRALYEAATYGSRASYASSSSGLCTPQYVIRFLT